MEIIRTMIHILTLIVSFIIINSIADTPILTLSEPDVIYKAHKYLTVYKDEQAKWEIDDFLEAKSSLADISIDQSINLGFIPHDAIWGELKIRNNTPNTSQWFAEVGFTGMDSVQLYTQDKNGKWIQKEAGRNHPVSQRDMHHNNTVFGFTVNPEQEKKLVFRFKNAGAVALPLFITSQKQMQKKINIDSFFKAIFFGFIIAIILYNVFLSISLREKRYFYYIVFQTAMLTHQFINNCYALILLWPETPILNGVDFNASILLAMVLPLFFFNAYIDTKQRFPKLNKLMIYFAFAQSLGAIFLPFAPIPESIRLLLMVYSIQFTTLLLFSVSLYVSIKGSREGLFFLAAWVAITLSMMIQTFWYQGLLPYNVFTSNLDEGFIILEALILTLGLSDRVSRIRKEKLATEKALISSQQNTIQALKKSDSLKDNIMAHVSHELRTPVTSMVGMADQLLDQADQLNQQQKQRLTLIKDSGYRLHYLINDMLDISVIKRGQLQLTLTPINLHTTFRDIQALIEPLIQNEYLSFQLIIDADLPMVTADEQRLHQILINLVNNAIKYTHKGTITLSAQQDDDHVVLSVKDTGIGIDAIDQKRIFQSFEQVNSFHEGTGLGLAITNQLVALHDSQITLSSQPSQGSKFSFPLEIYHCQDNKNALAKENEIIPKLQPKKTKIQQASHYQFISPVDASRKTLLIIDDETSNLEVLKGYLTEDYNILLTSSSHEGLDWLKRYAIDLILLDVMMPMLDGYQVCKQIRKTHPANRLPIIMLSAKNRQEDINQGFSSGANDYLTKPFYQKELFARLNAQLHLLTLNALTQKNMALQTMIDQLNESETPDEIHSPSDDFKEILVQLLQLCIETWESQTQTSQVELAEQSKIWRVSLDGSRMRARTLERYLHIDKLPKNPRWRDVAKTAHYLLDHLDMTDKQRSLITNQLNTLLERKRQLKTHRKSAPKSFA